jgi:hypothetical protein
MLLVLAHGCQLFQYFGPDTTWKLNRGPALDETDAYFSVADPPGSTSATECTAESEAER